MQYGTQILSFMGPKKWSLVPSTIKNSETLEIFKQKIMYKKVTAHVDFGKSASKALNIYKAVAFSSSFV